MKFKLRALTRNLPAVLLNEIVLLWLSLIADADGEPGFKKSIYNTFTFINWISKVSHNAKYENRLSLHFILEGCFLWLLEHSIKQWTLIFEKNAVYA